MNGAPAAAMARAFDRPFGVCCTLQRLMETWVLEALLLAALPCYTVLHMMCARGCNNVFLKWLLVLRRADARALRQVGLPSVRRQRQRLQGASPPHCSRDHASAS